MKKHFSKIFGVLLAVFLLNGAQLAGATFDRTETIISKPVGAGILPGGGSEGTDIKSSILFAKIIPFLINWTINLAIGLAVIMLIVGGYMYMTSYGDDEKKQRATRTITYSIIGLILAMTAYGIIFIITRIQLT